MLANEIYELLFRLREGLGQRDVALRCNCENLETVYVLRDENGAVRVSDDHRTFQYLQRGVDSTYDEVEKLDVTAIRRLCEGLNVELKDAPPDGYPSIECLVHPTQPIAEAVDRVARAIDRVFHLARRAHLE